MPGQKISLDDHDLLTVEEVARKRGVTTQAVRIWIKRKQLAAIRVESAGSPGYLYLIPREAAEAFQRTPRGPKPKGER